MRRTTLVLVLVALLLVTLALGVAVGTSSVDPTVLFGADDWTLRLRLRRVLGGALCGAGLAAAGTSFQALLRNPLADPYVVGVSGGAALGGVLALVLGIGSRWALPGFAFGGAVLSVLLLFALAQARGRTDPLTLLLIGVIFNAFAAAVVTFFKAVVSPMKAQEILFWLMGDISAESTSTVVALGVYVIAGLLVLQLLAGAHKPPVARR